MRRAAAISLAAMTLALGLSAAPAAAATDPTAASLGWVGVPARPSDVLAWARTLDARAASGKAPVGRESRSLAQAKFESRIELPAQHGYRIEVAASGSDVAMLVFRRRKHAVAASVYLARGSATRNRVQASFGRLGEVSMRFRPAHRSDPPLGRGRCSHRSLQQPGVYVGELRFRGEGGYIDIDAHRAKGAVDSPGLRCNLEAAAANDSRPLAQRAVQTTGESRFGPEHAYLAAGWRDGVSATQFAAFAGVKGKALFIAETETSEGALAIARFALAVRPHPGLEVDRALTRAHAAPPAPFVGGGSYRATADGSKAWTGKLAANFPGAPRVPLTGPQFKVEVGTLPALYLLFLL